MSLAEFAALAPWFPDEYWAATPAQPARKPSRKLSRCERRTSELLVELGPLADMTPAQRDCVNSIAVVCRGCGKCPAMRELNIMTRGP